MKEIKNYSLWMAPEGEVYDRFFWHIKRLAKEHDAPVFEPHVTLLGGIMQPEEDVIRKVQELVSGQKPFSIILRTVDYEDFYFRTLFIRAEETEPLLVLYNRAKGIFEMNNIPSYMPHLSLLYGNFPKTVKEKIVESIGSRQDAQFTIGSIHLFQTGGEVNTWHRVGALPIL